MQAVSIARSDLKGYTPKFTAAPFDRDSKCIECVKGDRKSLKFSDHELMPLVKLLHEIYTQNVS